MFGDIVKVGPSDDPKKLFVEWDFHEIHHVPPILIKFDEDSPGYKMVLKSLSYDIGKLEIFRLPDKWWRNRNHKNIDLEK
jgi:hypothetical protein